MAASRHAVFVHCSSCIQFQFNGDYEVLYIELLAKVLSMLRSALLIFIYPNVEKNVLGITIKSSN